MSAESSQLPSGPEYLVKEIFGPTIQGEGTHAGRACVFLRFAVCNLACSWCDTDFSADGAQRMTAADIGQRLEEIDHGASKLVIVTGGEPALQWDPTLAAELRGRGFSVHMESNGTKALKAPVDWLTISPKPQFHDGRFHLAPVLEAAADEIKVVVDDSVDSSVLSAYQKRYGTDRLCLQPCMDDDYERHLARTVGLVSAHPGWRLSLQLHKMIGVP